VRFYQAFGDFGFVNAHETMRTLGPTPGVLLLGHRTLHLRMPRVRVGLALANTAHPRVEWVRTRTRGRSLRGHRPPLSAARLGAS
jgi:hypothetical protein